MDENLYPMIFKRKSFHLFKNTGSIHQEELSQIEDWRKVIPYLRKENTGMFQNKVIVITGGANGIGKCIAEEFQKNGAHVCVIDRAEGDHYVGDLADKATLEDFARTVIEKYGRVDVLVNNAPPLFLGIDECTYEQFQQSMAIGVTAPFYLSKLFAPYFAPGASIQLLPMGYRFSSIRLHLLEALQLS